RTFQLHDVDEAIEDSVTFAHLVFEALHQTTELAEHEGFAFLQRGETNPTDDDFGALSRGHGHELVGGLLLEESGDVQVCFVHEAFVEVLLSVTVPLRDAFRSDDFQLCRGTTLAVARDECLVTELDVYRALFSIVVDPSLDSLAFAQLSREREPNRLEKRRFAKPV